MADGRLLTCSICAPPAAAPVPSCRGIQWRARARHSFPRTVDGVCMSAQAPSSLGCACTAWHPRAPFPHTPPHPGAGAKITHSRAACACMAWHGPLHGWLTWPSESCETCTALHRETHTAAPCSLRNHLRAIISSHTPHQCSSSEYYASSGAAGKSQLIQSPATSCL